jgi:hypothetical protein
MHDPSRITPERFTAILEMAQSPLAPEASEVYRILVSYGIDPAWALAYWNSLNEYGKRGNARTTRNIGHVPMEHGDGHGYSYYAGLVSYYQWIDGVLEWAQWWCRIEKTAQRMGEVE